MPDHLSFSISRQQLTNRILIPKLYDPELAQAIDEASRDFVVPTLGSLLEPGAKGSRLGIWVPREYYGSGSVPYIRTSDLNGWRIRPDHKKSVSLEFYERIAGRQDVKPGDILMVAHGTYLIGTVALVTRQDVPFVLQDHVFRLRVAKSAEIDPYLLIAALSTKFVRRQIRARQFSADIIDKIGERHLGIRVPLPKDVQARRHVSERVRHVIDRQSAMRKRTARLLGSDLRITRERSGARYGFSTPRVTVSSRILIPKYYDPVLRADLAEEEAAWGAPWVHLGSLVDAGLVSAGTGVEVGKMAYGTGTVPFVRTTDIADLTVRMDPRQGISAEIYEIYEKKASVRPGDVLLVRDGTYLVGSSAIVTKSDGKALICGGIFRLRCTSSDLDPHELLAFLNLPLVRRQMRSKQFTRDVIDTIGKRLFEVLVPQPGSVRAKSIGSDLRNIIEERETLVREAREVTQSIEPPVPKRSRTRPGWSMRA